MPTQTTCNIIDTTLVLLGMVIAILIAWYVRAISICLIQGQNGARNPGTPSRVGGAAIVQVEAEAPLISTTSNCTGSTIVRLPSSYPSSNRDADSIRPSSTTRRQDLAGIQTRQSSASEGRQLAASEIGTALMSLLEDVDYSAANNIDSEGDEVDSNHVTPSFSYDVAAADEGSDTE